MVRVLRDGSGLDREQAERGALGKKKNK